MKKVFKYPVNWNRTTVWMPKGAEILTVQVQNERPFLWALVDTDREPEERAFDVYGTGHEIQGAGKYVGTFQIGGVLVWHLFEVDPA